jgi:hypothetical protein
LLPEFRNEPMTDFAVASNRDAFAAALRKVEARLPLQGANRIGGERVGADKTFESANPCRKKQVIGRFPEGTAADANRARRSCATASTSSPR